VRETDQRFLLAGLALLAVGPTLDWFSRLGITHPPSV